MTVRRSIGPADTYPGGPRTLAREIGLLGHGGTMSYPDVEDAAVRAFHARRGRPRLVVTATMPVLGVRGRPSQPPGAVRSPSKAPAPTAPQKGAEHHE